MWQAPALPLRNLLQAKSPGRQGEGPSARTCVAGAAPPLPRPEAASLLENGHQRCIRRCSRRPQGRGSLPGPRVACGLRVHSLGTAPAAFAHEASTLSDGRWHLPHPQGLKEDQRLRQEQRELPLVMLSRAGHSIATRRPGLAAALEAQETPTARNQEHGDPASTQLPFHVYQAEKAPPSTVPDPGQQRPPQSKQGLARVSRG
ncbi:uncharacterized protein LOC112611631 [Theropithecus gelada]|uniref:uncharacterized protein LOC112611631 n=1 Tax=Theropithecus gelada TaxID=9565 RepID=UPI000DC184C1|nr:uncharacterized protein LOC112611631 [Theropithecus gelada]